MVTEIGVGIIATRSNSHVVGGICRVAANSDIRLYISQLLNNIAHQHTILARGLNMALMSRSDHAEQVEEAHQGDITRHDNRNTLWLNGFRVVTKPSHQLLAVKHLRANGLHGTQYIRARKPAISSDSLINNAVARVIATKARKSLT